MPCIKRLGGVKVYVFADDENPPHFHVRSADSNAKIRIDNLQIMRGTIKTAEYARIVEWAATCQDWLVEKWNEYNERD